MGTQPYLPHRPQVIKANHTCNICDIKKLLLEIANGEQIPVELADSIRCRGPFLPGDAIYKSGESLNTIYAVTSGCVKTETVNYDGFAQTTGFYLRGEIFGQEALGEKRHVYDAYAIERTWLCELPITSLNEICRQNPNVQNHLFRLIGRRTRSHLNLVNIRGRTADQRTMSFLSDLSERLLMRTPTLPDNEVSLPMSKEDIANYLGITPETVSRSLRHLDKTGQISYKGKSFHITTTAEEAEPIQKSCSSVNR